MIRFISWLVFFILLAPQIAAADEVNQLITDCDNLFDRDASYEEQIAKATEIRKKGIARNDDELVARGSIRMVLVEIHTGKWSNGWKSLRDEAIDLTEGLGQQSVARIEVQAFYGYLRARYLDQVKEGISDLRASIAAAVTLECDVILTRAHLLLGRVAVFDAQRLSSLKSLRLSIQFARHSKNEWAEFQAHRQFFYFADMLDLDVETELQVRFRELCVQLERHEALIMPDAERRAQMLTRINEFDALRDKPLIEAGKELEDCKDAARFLFWQFSKEDNWSQVERCLQIYEQIAKMKGDKSSQNEGRFLRAGLQARAGNVTQAQETLAAWREANPKRYQTPAFCFWMAEQFGTGGEIDRAAYWYEMANEARDVVQIGRASAISANTYFESLLSDRKLRGQIQQQERKLLNQRWLVFSLPLIGICGWLAQRTLQQRGRQKELQDRINEQTESLRLAKEKAEAQNHAKTEYVARINHEIRNPLTAIVACSELIADAQVSEEDRLEAQATLRTSSDNLLRLIGEVIDFSHIESGTLVACSNTFSPTELLDSVAAMIRPKLATGVELRLNTSINLPRLVVADETKIQQVLLNVAQNAVRHTTTGYVELGCQFIRSERESEKAFLTWTIRDTGSGMSQEQINAAFTRAATALTGTGLGLYISKSLVDCMQGTIACESESDQGTTFTVCIPFQEADTPEIRTEPKPPTDTGVVRNVLVFDDEPMNRKVLDKLLKMIGCDCDVADTWPVAESLLVTKEFDVVLLDLRMPEMDGFEVFRRLTDLPISYKPRVYAMTGDATETRRQQVAAAGFAGFLAKPFSTADLSDIIGKNSETTQGSR